MFSFSRKVWPLETKAHFSAQSRTRPSAMCMSLACTLSVMRTSISKQRDRCRGPDSISTSETQIYISNTSVYLKRFLEMSSDWSCKVNNKEKLSSALMFTHAQRAGCNKVTLGNVHGATRTHILNRLDSTKAGNAPLLIVEWSLCVWLLLLTASGSQTDALLFGLTHNCQYEQGRISFKTGWDNKRDIFSTAIIEGEATKVMKTSRESNYRNLLHCEVKTIVAINNYMTFEDWGVWTPCLPRWFCL